MNYLSEGIRLYKNKQYLVLFRKVQAILKQKLLKIGFIFSFQKKPVAIYELERNWIVFNYLHYKFRRVIKTIPKVENKEHNYNDVIWWCWLQGEDHAPELCKACLASLKRNFPDKQINIITINNIEEWVTFPDYIIEKYKKGIIDHAHFSDLLRLELLIRYGGVWIDSTVYCTGRMEEIFKIPLFVYRNHGDESIVASNWLIASEKDNPILMLTRTLLYEYWKHYDYCIHYYVFHMFFTMATKFYKEEWDAVPNFSNTMPHILQKEMLDKYTNERMEYIKRISVFHKLTYKFDEKVKDTNSFYDCILNTN